MKYFVMILVGLLLAGCNSGMQNANAVDRAHSAIKSACDWKSMRYSVTELDNNITYTLTCVRGQ